MSTEATEEICDEIAAVRQAQDSRWGGPGHDDKHSVADFVQWIEDYAGWARMRDSSSDPEATRKALLDVASLAVACIEMLDRRP